MVKLRRLSIKKYRVVKPGTVLSFNDSYNVLLGINGTGKTTLLNLIVMCLSSSFAGLEDEEFALEYELTIPEGAVLISVSNQRIEIEPRERSQRVLAATIDLQFIPKGSSGLPFRLTLERGVLSQDGEKIDTPFHNISPFGAKSFAGQMLFYGRHLIRASSQRSNVIFHQVEASLEQRQAYSRFDEGTEWLREVLEEASIELLVMSLEDVHTQQLNLIAAGLESAIYGRVRQSDPAGAGWRKATSLTFSQSELAFLGQAVDALKYKAATLELELQSVEPQPDAEQRFADGLTFGRPKIFFSKRDGAYLSLDRLSFGQKRLVAFFYYLAMYPSVLIADELANGLHHAMIESCLEAAGQRQKFLATQNPLLLDHVPLESAEDVRATFIRCEVAMTGKREQMVWSALTEEESVAFFKDYEVGIQHTNDILRLRGLW